MSRLDCRIGASRTGRVRRVEAESRTVLGVLVLRATCLVGSQQWWARCTKVLESMQEVPSHMGGLFLSQPQLLPQCPNLSQQCLQGVKGLIGVMGRDTPRAAIGTRPYLTTGLEDLEVMQAEVRSVARGWLQGQGLGTWAEAC